MNRKPFRVVGTTLVGAAVIAACAPNPQAPQVGAGRTSGSGSGAPTAMAGGGGGAPGATPPGAAPHAGTWPPDPEAGGSPAPSPELSPDPLAEASPGASPGPGSGSSSSGSVVVLPGVTTGALVEGGEPVIWEPTSEGLHDLAVVAPRPSLAPFMATGELAVFNRAPDLIAFSARRVTAGVQEDYDIFIYDRVAQSIFVPPGVNTTANEVDPQISTHGRWLVYATDLGGEDLDVNLLDVGLGVIDTLTGLNTAAPAFLPEVDDTGRLIAYQVRVRGQNQLRLYSLVSERTFVPAALNGFQDGDLQDLAMAPSGTLVALVVATPTMGTDLVAYDLESGAILTLPFLNSGGNERDPAFSADGTRLLFVTDVDGQSEIRLMDLTTFAIDRLSLLNTAEDESAPSFVGLSDEVIQYQTMVDGVPQARLFDRVTGVVDTLPIVNRGGSEVLLGPGPTPSPTPMPTPTPSETPSPTPTPTVTPTPDGSATPTPDVSPTPTPEVSPTPTPEVSPTPTPLV